MIFLNAIYIPKVSLYNLIINMVIIQYIKYLVAHLISI